MNASINKGERPKVLSSREDWKIIKYFERGNTQKTTLKVELIKYELGKDVWNSSVRNIVYKNGHKNYKNTFKPLISPTNIKNKKDYYDTHKSFNYQDCTNYEFSNKSYFKLLNCKGVLHNTKRYTQTQIHYHI